MSKQYIEIQPVAGFTQEELVKELSKVLWNLQRPDSVKAPKDVTKYMFGVSPHPLKENDWVLEITDDSINIKKHTDAIASEILTVADSLSEADKTGLTDLITNNTEIPMSSIISSLREQILSYAVWSDFANAHPFSLQDKVAVTEQVDEQDTLVFYNCIQAHNKQADWDPTSTPALWSKVTVTGDIEVWAQPTGGDGKYVEGAVVTHNGSTWDNTHTGGLNVWEPGVFGWTERV